MQITESSVLSDPTRIGLVLEALRKLGIGLSLDDFGTGYSALTHLRDLPVTEVKIDRSFVSSMQTEPADAAIVEATIGLARRIGIVVVANGVEKRCHLGAAHRPGLRPDPGLRPEPAGSGRGARAPAVGGAD